MHLSLVLEVFDGKFFAALGFITSQRGVRCFIVGLPQNVLNLECRDSTEDLRPWAKCGSLCVSFYFC